MRLHSSAQDRPKPPFGGAHWRATGVHEVAELLGISKSALADRRRSRKFPDPLVTLRCGPIWNLTEIRAYKKSRERNPFAAYYRR